MLSDKKIDIRRRTLTTTTTGTVLIQDEGVDVGTVGTLNFIGTDVEAMLGSGRVNVYIPPPVFSSFYNDGAATVSDVSTVDRHVADPVGGVYKIGGWSAGSVQPTVRTSSMPLVYDTTGTFSIENNTSCILKAEVLDDDDATVIATHQITLSSDIDQTIQNIRIQITDFQTEATRYACRAIVSFNIDSILTTGGRFSIKITQTNPSLGTYIKEQGPIHYDTESNTASLNTVTIAETGGAVVTNQISGVYFYTTGSQFTVNIADIDWLNDRSYPDDQVEVQGSEYGLPTLLLEGSDLTGWTNAYNDVNSSFNKTDWAINATNFCSLNATANISARTKDWSDGSWSNSGIASIYVNTYTDNSTRVYEDFRTETRRLESDFSTSWDSTQNLGSYDDNTGLQLRCSRLIYPTINYSSFSPNLGSQPDYSSLSGDRTFYRNMWHSNVSHSNGTFQFSDYNITETDITNDNIQIWISLDNSSWYAVHNDYTGGPLTDGDGCRVNPDTINLSTNNRIAFTLGTGGFTSASTGGGWGVHIKILYESTMTTRYIGVFQIIDWS